MITQADKSVDQILSEFNREIKEVRWEFRPGRTSAALTAGRLKSLCRQYGTVVSAAEARPPNPRHLRQAS